MTTAEPEATTAKQDTAPALPFRVKPGDLVLRAKITLQDHEGVEVVDVENLMKIDSVLGEFAYISALRRVERSLEFVAVTPFQVQVCEFLQQELLKRKKIDLVTPAFGANREWPEQGEQPDIANQLKERMEKPMLRPVSQMDADERMRHEEEHGGHPVSGFFRDSAV